MTPEEIRERVNAIREIALDDEEAHRAEDALMRDVLAAIELGLCDNPATCAAEALKSRTIKFARWCA